MSANSLMTRGYRITYRLGAVNYCPGCGHANWYLGRFSAECAFCATCLPLERRSGTAERDPLPLAG
jgi:hypothetical protein